MRVCWIVVASRGLERDSRERVASSLKEGVVLELVNLEGRDDGGKKHGEGEVSYQRRRAA